MGSLDRRGSDRFAVLCRKKDRSEQSGITVPTSVEMIKIFTPKVNWILGRSFGGDAVEFAELLAYIESCGRINTTPSDSVPGIPDSLR
jgi:hypothetical protein